MNRWLTALCLALIVTTTVWTRDALSSGTSDQAELVRDNNALAIELYGQLKNQPGNLFFSPESLSTALAMTYAGARGRTAAEMAVALHFTLPPEKLHSAMGALLHDLNTADDGYELRVANALWGQQGYTFLDDFLKLTKDNYGAGLDQVDFKDATESARLTINQWVEQQTEEKIKDLIAPGILDAKTRLVLTNAIYFKGAWQTQFKKEDTKNEGFHVSAAQTTKAPLMHRTGEFSYFDGGTFQALEIPYKNRELSMIVLLPKNADGLSAFEQSLTPASMQQWLEQLRLCPEVIVTMPKFGIESHFGLNRELSNMGMEKAFDRSIADFSGMASKEVIQREGNLYINAVIHRANVDVNETGTEAAVTTAVMAVEKVRAALAKPPARVFHADHPFMFLIRDNRSGSILFIGRLIDPSK